ncbi:glycoside hydrolase superfamily, partial [Dimargaris cristalligena]
AGEPKLPPQLVVYWGQNSNGAINPGDRSVWEKPLAKYCEDRVADVFVLSFLISFQPMVLNFAYHCETTFPGSSLLNCPDIGADIKACQKLGARVLLSLGGASGSYGFSSDSQGREFAHTLWQTFFVSPVSGSSGTAPLRPFGDAVLDGIDLDIEGGSTVGYVALVSELRTLFATDPSKRYLIAAAPQCPYPDALLQPVLNQAWVDLVMVQFYNNYCGVNHYPAQYNFQTWDTWARTVSINPNVSVLVGVPGGPAAAQSGFVAASTLQTIIADTRQRYPSFGGVMVWEASMAWATGFASQAM